MSKDKTYIPIKPDWWLKSFFGVFLGLIFAMGFSNVLIILLKPYLAMDLLVQIGMWSIPWIWMPVLFGCFYISSGWRVAGFLLSANAIVFILIFLLRA